MINYKQNGGFRAQWLSSKSVTVLRTVTVLRAGQHTEYTELTLYLKDSVSHL